MDSTAFMILSAPSSTSTLTLRFSPSSSIVPAGIFRSFTSPAGVLITTAERFPIRARAMGTTCRVSSEDRPNRVAMP